MLIYLGCAQLSKTNLRNLGYGVRCNIVIKNISGARSKLRPLVHLIALFLLNTTPSSRRKFPPRRSVWWIEPACDAI